MLIDPSVTMIGVRLGGANVVHRQTSLIGIGEAGITLGYASVVGSHSTLSGIVDVGRYSQIGSRVAVHSLYHPMNRASNYRSSRFPATVDDEDNCIPVAIGHDVWIGDGAIILRGVHVADGAIVGAGAVVTKDVPAYAVAVGNPAHVIRTRFDERVVQALSSLRWWDLDLRELKMLEPLFDRELDGEVEAALGAIEQATALKTALTSR